MGGSLLNTRLYGGSGEVPRIAQTTGMKKGAKGALFPRQIL
jgi:hypothetical protein